MNRCDNSLESKYSNLFTFKLQSAFKTVVVVAITLLSLFSILLVYSLPSIAQVAGPPAICVTYDPEENVITVTCKSASLTDIDKQLKNQNVVHREKDGVWFLNAGIVVAPNATLSITSKDTSWLKIGAGDESKTEHLIDILGSLIIDSVKITSWNPNTNYYATTNDSFRHGNDVNVG